MEEKIFDTDFLKKLDSIALNAKMFMNGGASGGRKSKAKGSSVEFSDFREYTIGDDFRRIDWNAYGRFDRLFVKLFMEEREALINIFIDTSKSMDFGTPKKSILALKLAAVFSFMGVNNLDRVCINDMKDGMLKQAPSITGRTMFPRSIMYLQSINFSGTTDINACIRKKELKTRGISIILSDFFTKSGLEEAIKYLRYKNQEVILMHILSPEELQPDLQGQVRLVDSETGEAKNIVVTSALLSQYAKYLNSFTTKIKEFSNKMGASYIQVSSAEPIEKIIFENLTKANVIV